MKNYQSGQIVLLVILIMTIALTIGLSLASRTITNIRTTSEEESSQRAFSAAEAGIERSLQSNRSATGTFTSNTSSYQTTLTTVSGQEFLLNNGDIVLKDDGTDVWLSTYPGYTSPWTGFLTIYWAKSTDACASSESTNSLAALEIVLITGTRVAPRLTHYPVDPCPARANANKFEVIPRGGRTINGQVFVYQKTIRVVSGLLMRVVPLYAQTHIAVRGCDAANRNCSVLPSQGTLVTSVGTSGNTQRKIVGFRENPKLPIQVFPYTIFSP